MKKILLLLMACMFISVSMRAQDVPSVIIGVTLDPCDTIYLDVGQSVLFTATPRTDDGQPAENDSVTWILNENYTEFISIDTTTTSDDKTCFVLGLAPGDAKIMVKTISGNKRDSCVIRVIQKVESVTLNEHTMSLELDEESFLIANVLPENASNDSVIWVSRNPSLINITTPIEDQYGTKLDFQGVKPGKTFIVVETIDGHFKDSCEVTVAAETITSITLSKTDTLDLSANEEAELIAHISPTKGTYKLVDWIDVENSGNIFEIKSEDYDTICLIKALNIGEAKIVAKTLHGGLTDTCVIRVNGIRLESMSLDKDTILLNIKKESSLSAIITPSNATNKSIIWRTGDASIVSLDTTSSNKYKPTCNIKAGFSGGTYIYAAAVDSVGIGEEFYIDSCYVRVIVPVDSIVLRAEFVDENGVTTAPIDLEEIDHGKAIRDMNLVTDSIVKITATVWPDSATNNENYSFGPLVWNNFDLSLSRIEAIDGDTICNITAFWAGVDTLAVTTADGSVSSDIIFIHIDIRQVDKVEISYDDNLEKAGDTILLDVNDSFEFATTVYPWNATNDTLQFTIEAVEGTGVVEADSTTNGVAVRALNSGTAIVRVMPTDDGEGEIDSCIIRVSSVPASGISLNKDTVWLYEQRTDSVFATIRPANATNKSVTWSSSDNTIVSITSAGTDTICTFKALKADTAYIYAETNDGAHKDALVVVVKEQLVVIEADTTATNNGKIAFSLSIPTDVKFAGSFELHLPNGFGLTKDGDGYATTLADEFKESLDLTITRLTDSTYTFTLDSITEPTTNSMLRSGTMTKIMDIAYTIYNNDLDGSALIYNVIFKNVAFGFSDETEINEDRIDVEVKAYKSATGNEIFDGQQASAYLMDGSLYVNSEKAETVYVYSLNGSLLFTGKKTDGQVVFNVNTQEKVLIVKGSSGWVSKVANR